MPKLNLKVKNRHIDFLKNQLEREDNAKLWRGGVNHDPKVYVGVVDDLKKKFQPLFSIFCLPKKNKLKSLSCAKCQKIIIFGIWKVTPLLKTTSASEFTCFFNHQPHLVQCNKKNISLKAYITAKRPENIYFGGIKDKKLIIYPLKLVWYSWNFYCKFSTSCITITNNFMMIGLY